MTVQRPRFDPTINYGHLLQVGMLILTIFGFAYKFGSFQTEVTQRLDAADKWALRVAPMIDGMNSSQAVQDERIANLSSAVVDIRNSNSQVLLKIEAMRDDLAGIKVRLQATPK
ncbi:hypothetical protein ASC80_01805 [Afipia sp. Root123D2]|nr:hypothetical protein ASC80_01805 [Afipia sp. Root123D2]